MTADTWSAPFSFADILGDSVALSVRRGGPFVPINCGTQSDVPRHPADVTGP